MFVTWLNVKQCNTYISEFPSLLPSALEPTDQTKGHRVVSVAAAVFLTHRRNRQQVGVANWVFLCHSLTGVCPSVHKDDLIHISNTSHLHRAIEENRVTVQANYHGAKIKPNFRGDKVKKKKESDRRVAGGLRKGQDMIVPERDYDSGSNRFFSHLSWRWPACRRRPLH